MPSCLYLYFKTGYRNETKYTYIWQCALCFRNWCFHVVSSFVSLLRALITFFKLVAVEFFGLLPKPFSYSTFNFFVTCEVNSLWMLLDNCKQLEASRCQTALGRLWDGIKYVVIYRHWSGSSCVGCAVVTFKKRQFIFPTNVLDFSSQPIWGLHISLRIDFLPTTMYVRWMIPLQSQKTVRKHIPAPGWVLNIFSLGALGWVYPSN